MTSDIKMGSPNREQQDWDSQDSRIQQSQQEDTRTRGQDEAANPGNTLYVRGIHPRVEQSQLESLFHKFGTILSSSVAMDPHTGENRGFGFITFESMESADEAIRALHGSELDGRALLVEKSRRGRPRTPTPGSYRGHARQDPYRRGGYREEHEYRPRRYEDIRHSRPRYDDRPPRRYEDREYYQREEYDRPRREGYSSRRFQDSKRYDDRGGDGRSYERHYDDRRR